MYRPVPPVSLEYTVPHSPPWIPLRGCWWSAATAAQGSVSAEAHGKCPCCCCSVAGTCSSVQFSSVAQSCPTLCDPMDCNTSGFPVHHQLSEFTQTHVHSVSDAIEPSHPLSSPSPTSNLSHHQGLFKWISSSHQVAKLLEFQLQHQPFQWIFRTAFL